MAHVDLHGEDDDRRELGFCVGGRVRWGRGLGTRAAAAGLRYGFEVLGLVEVWAEALDANRRSVRVLQRIGMRETGRGADGVFVDQPSYHRGFVVTAEEWNGA